MAPATTICFLVGSRVVPRKSSHGSCTFCQNVFDRLSSSSVAEYDDFTGCFLLELGHGNVDRITR